MRRGPGADGRRPRPRRGDVPRQLWPPRPGLHRRDHAVRPDDDGQCRVADEGLQGGAPVVAGEPDVRPSSVGVRTGLPLVLVPRRPADPGQQKAVPAAEVRQFAVRLPRGQHGHPAGQDRVEPDRWTVTRAHQRVGDQAAAPQCGRGAGREEAPRGVLHGAGLEPWCGGGGHGLADAVAADGGGQRDPADSGGPVLASGHRPADPDGLFHHGPGVRAAFGVVAGE